MRLIKPLNYSTLCLLAFALGAPGAAFAAPDLGHMAMSGHHEQESETFPFGHPGKAAEVDRVIKVKAKEFKFIPSDIKVNAGETIRFEVTNTGTVDHEFVLGTKQEQVEHDKEMAEHPHMKMDDPNGVAVPVGKTRSLVWKFTKPMTIQYACHVPGHYAAGMYGKLVIRPASS